MHRTMTVLSALMAITGLATGAAAQDSGASTGVERDRVEIPEAGIAVAFPDEWSVVVQMIRDEASLPPESSGADPVDLWVVVDAAGPDGSGCRVMMYGEHPLEFTDHAAWIETGVAGETDVTSVATTPVTLPTGDAVRVSAVIEDVGVWTSYLLETQQARYRLDCLSAEMPDDAWMTIAESVESIPSVPLESPGTNDPTLAADVDYVLDFPTVVSVVPAGTPDFPVASLMNADCAFAIRILAEDGSAEEWLACTLSDDPIQPAEQQGVPPSEIVSESGGECVWRSDYWYETDRSQVVASAYGLTVTPDGQVFGWSTYPAERLDCAGM